MIPAARPIEFRKRAARTARARATGFTLVELLIVLGLVATLGMIAYPNVSRRMERAEHVAAAEGIHATLTRLRLKAIETGRPHAFRFQSGASDYAVQAVAGDEVASVDFDSSGLQQPEFLDVSLINAETTEEERARANAPIVDSIAVGEVSEEVDSERSLRADADQTERRRLANGFVLTAMNAYSATTLSAAGVLDDEDLFANDAAPVEDVSLSGGDSLAVDDWAESIVFFPDGRSNDARLAVVAPDGFSIEISVVGMSGRVSIGERLRDEKHVAIADEFLE